MIAKTTVPLCAPLKILRLLMCRVHRNGLVLAEDRGCAEAPIAIFHMLASKQATCPHRVIQKLGKHWSRELGDKSESSRESRCSNRERQPISGLRKHEEGQPTKGLRKHKQGQPAKGHPLQPIFDLIPLGPVILGLTCCIRR